ncbi:MAG: hypothetical protein GX477_05950 [Clostridiaceae bacterium]|nr:hypothetical protein [Clostridiaceae bacterium]
MKRNGNCGNCARGTSMKVNPDIFCTIHGVVSRNYRCSKYMRKPAQWSTEAPVADPGERWENRCIDCEFFLARHPEPGHSPTTGFCKLFTVRHYDGSTRKACSRFSRKREKSISAS